VDVLSSRILLRPVGLDRSQHFYRDVLGQTESWGLTEMWIEEPDGVRIVLVEVPADHPLRRDSRSSAPPT
jgi:hypothetical protein